MRFIYQGREPQSSAVSDWNSVVSHCTGRSLNALLSLTEKVLCFSTQDVQNALDTVGVAQIACNPITDNNAAKALQRAAAEEAMPLSKEQALSIARSAAGDLRSALELLQLLCTGVAPLPPQPKTRKVVTAPLSSHSPSAVKKMREEKIL